MKVVYFIIIIFLNSYTLAEVKSNSDFHINANRLIIKDNPLVSEFIGNVYARNTINRFWGERILIDYDNNKKIKTITIIGNVKIKRFNEVATGNRAVYNVKSEKIKMNGNVTLIKNGNILNGDELVVDLITSTSIIRGNIDKQVSAKVVK